MKLEVRKDVKLIPGERVWWAFACGRMAATISRVSRNGLVVVLEHGQGAKSIAWTGRIYRRT